MPESLCSDATPLLRGRLRSGVSMAGRCWFGVGGDAEWLFTPADAADLSEFLYALKPDVPVTVLGVGSNILIRDGGISGVVIRLGRGFTHITHEDNKVTAGAAALDAHISSYALKQGLAGAEFLSGIPGTLGGGVMMNAGAYGSDMSHIVTSVTLMDRNGQTSCWCPDQLAFEYRCSAIPDTHIVLEAELALMPGDASEIAVRMEQIAANRQSTQPVRSRTGGSTFRNPPHHKAWELIDAAGCRGLQQGDAQLSPMHCNFLINHGNATANDLESLGEQIRRRVKHHSNIELQWEIKRLGHVVADSRQV